MADLKIFVVSLPRSGTSSLTRMADLAGFKGRHAIGKDFRFELYNTDYNFFSDTPVYAPSVITKICEDKTINSKFIFIDKDFTSLYLSWKKMSLNYYYNQWHELPLCKMHDFQKVNFVMYSEAFNGELLMEDNYETLFKNHKNRVIEIIKSYNKDLLLYDFKDGWKPFCDFLEVSVPDGDLPHLNKDSFLEYVNKYTIFYSDCVL